MHVEIQAIAPEQADADVVAVPLAGDDGLTGAAAALDSTLGGLLGRLAGDGELRNDAGRTSIVHVDGKLATGRVAVAGLGDRLDADALRTAAGRPWASPGTRAWVTDASLPVPADEQVRAIVEGTAIGAYETARWKRDEPATKLSRLVLVGDTSLADTAKRAETVAEWTNRAR